MGKVKPLGLLAVAALGYLAERPMHPYEMYQLALHRQEDRVVKVSPGSLYRAVYGLEADGLVLASGTDREGARPERTTFEITDLGRHLLGERLRELLSTPTNEYPELGLALNEKLAAPIREWVAGRVALAVAAGDVRADVDAAAIADQFVAMASYAALLGRPLDAGRVDATVAVLLRGIMAG